MALRLIREGDGLEARDDERMGHAPLHLPARHGRTAPCGALLAATVDVGATFGANAVTALSLAAQEGRSECLAQLISAGADVNTAK